MLKYIWKLKYVFQHLRFRLSSPNVNFGSATDYEMNHKRNFLLSEGSNISSVTKRVPFIILRGVKLIHFSINH